MFFLIIFVIELIGFYNLKQNLQLVKIINKIKNNGFDQRNVQENVTSISEIATFMSKKELLKELEDENIIEQKKLQLIYASHFLEELNPHVIKAPNLTKGLKW
jgi:hypothetical protein